MVNLEIGAMAVMQEWKKKPFINGIITERDIIQKVASLGRNPKDTLVSFRLSLYSSY
jgi:hypothetical protein